MMLLLFITELILLYLLSRRVIQTLYSLLHMLTRSRTVAIWIVSIVFFPGTVVHELAHLFTAEILGVRTGKLTLIPESLEGTEIKAGGVMIAETDPLRRTAIGLAPVIWGITLLTALSYFIRHSLAASQESVLQNAFLFYLLFAISNSMFSSKEDMKGVIPFMITVVLFGAAGYVAGFRLGFTDALLAGWNPVLQTLVQTMAIVLVANFLSLTTTTIALSIIKKLS